MNTHSTPTLAAVAPATYCSALRDCPFCGMEEPHMGIDGTVTCGNCGAKGPWDKDAYDGAGNEQEMWNARRDITTSDVQAFLIDAHQRMQDEIRDIPRTGTGTLTRRHKLRGAMDFGIELSNWISRREIELSRQNAEVSHGDSEKRS